MYECGCECIFTLQSLSCLSVYVCRDTPINDCHLRQHKRGKGEARREERKRNMSPMQSFLRFLADFHLNDSSDMEGISIKTLKFRMMQIASKGHIEPEDCRVLAFVTVMIENMIGPKMYARITPDDVAYYLEVTVVARGTPYSSASTVSNKSRSRAGTATGVGSGLLPGSSSASMHASWTGDTSGGGGAPAAVGGRGTPLTRAFSSYAAAAKKQTPAAEPVVLYADILRRIASINLYTRDEPILDVQVQLEEKGAVLFRVTIKRYSCLFSLPHIPPRKPMQGRKRTRADVANDENNEIIHQSVHSALREDLSECLDADVMGASGTGNSTSIDLPWWMDSAHAQYKAYQDAVDMFQKDVTTSAQKNVSAPVLHDEDLPAIVHAVGQIETLIRTTGSSIYRNTQDTEVVAIPTSTTSQTLDNDGMKIVDVRPCTVQVHAKRYSDGHEGVVFVLAKNDHDPHPLLVHVQPKKTTYEVYAIDSMFSLTYRDVRAAHVAGTRLGFAYHDLRLESVVRETGRPGELDWRLVADIGMVQYAAVNEAFDCTKSSVLASHPTFWRSLLCKTCMRAPLSRQVGAYAGAHVTMREIPDGTLGYFLGATGKQRIVEIEHCVPAQYSENSDDDEDEPTPIWRHIPQTPPPRSCEDGDAEPEPDLTAQSPAAKSSRHKGKLGTPLVEDDVMTSMSAAENEPHHYTTHSRQRLLPPLIKIAPASSLVEGGVPVAKRGRY